MEKAALIGAGEIGQAIGRLLGNNNVDHLFWDKDPDKSAGDLSSVLSGADVIFFCVPSWNLREALFSAKERVKGSEILVFVSKGLEPETGMNAIEIALDVLPEAKLVFIGGPMIAEEIMLGKGGAAVIASKDARAAQIVKEGLSSADFFATVSDDIQGIVFAGVLKNIYALIIGAAEGLGYGVNIKGFMMTESLSEMGDVITSLGGKKDAAYGKAGLGDFIATASGSSSSNWSAGFSFANGENPKKVSEGMSSFSCLHRRLGDISKFKILSASGDIMENKDPKSSIDKAISGK